VRLRKERRRRKYGSQKGINQGGAPYTTGRERNRKGEKENIGEMRMVFRKSSSGGIGEGETRCRIKGIGGKEVIVMPSKIPEKANAYLKEGKNR